jgi:hypothetical protein
MPTPKIIPTQKDPYGARRRAASAKLQQLEAARYLATADYQVIQNGIWVQSQPDLSDQTRHEMLRSALLRAAVCRHDWTAPFNGDDELWIAVGLMPALNKPDAQELWRAVCAAADVWQELTGPAGEGVDVEARELARRDVDDVIDVLVRKARG